MLSPPVMMIEMAADSLKDVPEWLQDSQRRELYSFGPGRASKLGATLSDDFRIGYELGLATARTILSQAAGLPLHQGQQAFAAWRELPAAAGAVTSLRRRK